MWFRLCLNRMVLSGSRAEDFDTQITDYAEEQGYIESAVNLAVTFIVVFRLRFSVAMLGWIARNSVANATHIQHAHRLD